MLRCSIKDEYSYMESTSPPFGSELLELSRVPIKGERDSSTFSGDIPDSHSRQVWILFLRALTLPNPRKHQATRNFGGAIKHQNHISEHNFPNFDTIRIFASSGKRSNRLIPGDSIDQPFFNNGNNLRTTGSGVDEGDQQRLLIWQLTIAVGGGEPESLSLSVWFTIWPSLLPVSTPSPPTLSPSLSLSLFLWGKGKGKRKEERVGRKMNQREILFTVQCLPLFTLSLTTKDAIFFPQTHELYQWYMSHFDLKVFHLNEIVMVISWTWASKHTEQQSHTHSYVRVLFCQLILLKCRY